MIKKTILGSETIYDYILNHSLREHPCLSKLRQATAKLPESIMQIAPEQGQFMALLAQIIGATKIIEVGTFTGYSALCFALALPETGQLHSFDISEEWPAIGEPFWQEAGVAHKIKLHIGPALNSLNTVLQTQGANAFDMGFIDADKTNYKQYYEILLKLVRPGGLILIDNVLWSGAVADPEDNNPSTIALRELNTFIHHDQRVAIAMLPVADGLTIVRKLDEGG